LEVDRVDGVDSLDKGGTYSPLTLLFALILSAFSLYLLAA
jgi:hypothetical protein